MNYSGNFIQLWSILYQLFNIHVNHIKCKQTSLSLGGLNVTVTVSWCWTFLGLGRGKTLNSSELLSVITSRGPDLHKCHGLCSSSLKQLQLIQGALCKKHAILWTPQRKISMTQSLLMIMGWCHHRKYQCYQSVRKHAEFCWCFHPINLKDEIPPQSFPPVPPHSIVAVSYSWRLTQANELAKSLTP